MKIKEATILIILMLICTTFVVADPLPPFDGPNYMGIESKDVTIDDTFYTNVWANIGSSIDVVAMDNFTFLSAGIITYEDVAQGDLFAGETLWITPAYIHNDTGWAKPIVWGYNTPVNGVNKTAFNITWIARKVGQTTITITAGGTARNGTDPGTTKYPGIITVHPQPTTGFSATALDQNNIGLSWTKGVGVDRVVIRGSKSGYPTTPQSDTDVYNNTGTGTTHSGLSPGQTWYYRAWGWNTTAGFFSLLNQTDYDTTPAGNRAPTLSSENPTDNSGNIDKNKATVSVIINDPDGNTFNWQIHGTHVTTNSGSGATNGTKTANLITPLPYGTNVIWYVNVTDGSLWTNATYNFTVRSQYTPSPPSGFNAIAFNSTQINMSWTKGSGGDKVVIVAKLGSAPTGIGDGTIIYNGTGTSYNDDGLGPNQHWYYIAYSWNTTDKAYSATYVSSDATTLAINHHPQVTPIHPANNAPYESVYNEYLKVHVIDNDDDTMTVHIDFSWATGSLSYTADTVTNNTDVNLSLPTYISPDWLQHKNQRPEGYTWYVNVTDGTDWTNNTWHFNTSYAWDINEDRYVNSVDISLIVSHYKNTMTAGQYGWDIIENGKVDYRDISILVYHYGETY